jgi:hypothetical protein
MHVLLKEVGISDSKQDLLEGYGVEHTTQLTDEDLIHLVNRLGDMKQEKISFQDAETKRWRSNLLTLLNKYGIYADNRDWSAVNKFLLSNKICGKVMYEMDIKDLKETCLKLRIIIAKRQEIMERNDHLAKLN